jgi:hypothetical protein
LIVEKIRADRGNFSRGHLNSSGTPAYDRRNTL